MRTKAVCSYSVSMKTRCRHTESVSEKRKLDRNMGGAKLI